MWHLFGEAFDDSGLEGLVLLVADIERDLVCVQELLVVLGQFFHQCSSSFGDLKVELALGDFVVVEVALVVTVLVNQEQKAQYLRPEVLLLHNLLRQGERVAQVLLNLVSAQLDGLLHLVQSARLQGDSDDVLELFVVEAARKHFVNDYLHLRVDRHGGDLATLGRASLSRRLLLVHHLLLLLDVLINALVDELLDILALVIEVELVAGLEREPQRLVVLLEVVVDLGGHGAGELLLGELLVLRQFFTVALTKKYLGKGRRIN